MEKSKAYNLALFFLEKKNFFYWGLITIALLVFALNFFLKGSNGKFKEVEGKTIQRLLNKNEGFVPKLTEKALKSLKRTEKELPTYSEFARTSLLIIEKKYDVALQHSLQLKEELKNSKETALYGHNLLRIAFLERKLHQKESDKSKKELCSFLNHNPNLLTGFKDLESID